MAITPLRQGLKRRSGLGATQQGWPLRPSHLPSWPQGGNGASFSTHGCSPTDSAAGDGGRLILMDEHAMEALSTHTGAWMHLA
eukprot:829493-Alexandrium_andersonii.AAC.1